jgi:hypothetical protein
MMLGERVGVSPPVTPNDPELTGAPTLPRSPRHKGRSKS